MYFFSTVLECTRVLLIYDEATLHAAGTNSRNHIMHHGFGGLVLYTSFCRKAITVSHSSPWDMRTPRKNPKLLVGTFRNRCEGIPQTQMQCGQGEIWSDTVKAWFYFGVSTGWAKLFSWNYSSTTATLHGSGFAYYKESARFNLTNISSLWYSQKDIQ